MVIALEVMQQQNGNHLNVLSQLVIQIRFFLTLQPAENSLPKSQELIFNSQVIGVLYLVEVKGVNWKHLFLSMVSCAAIL